MDRLDVIEACRGTGHVYRDNGEFVRRAGYHLEVLQEVHESPSGDILGLQRIEGRVELESADLHLVGKALVLHLEDGRQLDFFYTDSGGTIADRGHGLYRP